MPIWILRRGHPATTPDPNHALRSCPSVNPVKSRSMSSSDPSSISRVLMSHPPSSVSLLSAIIYALRYSSVKPST